MPHSIRTLNITEYFLEALITFIMFSLVGIVGNFLSAPFDVVDSGKVSVCLDEALLVAIRNFQI